MEQFTKLQILYLMTHPDIPASKRKKFTSAYLLNDVSILNETNFFSTNIQYFYPPNSLGQHTLINELIAVIHSSKDDANFKNTTFHVFKRCFRQISPEKHIPPLNDKIINRKQNRQRKCVT